MPTILRAGGFRVYFWSHEPGEPAHLHVDRSGSTAKVWLEPVAIASSAGFSARELGDVVSWCGPGRRFSNRHGMTSSTQIQSADIRVRDVSVSDDELTVQLMDGRTISVPLAWYPRLLNGSPAQRASWEIAGAGFGIHWPDLDEDLSTEGLLRGLPAPRGSERWRA